MIKLITVKQELIVLDGQPLIIRFGEKRTDKLFDLYGTSPFATFVLAFGVEQARRNDVLAAAYDAIAVVELVDLRAYGTGEEDAPNIIRPQQVDLAALKIQH
jgi:hypothetical protein